MDSLYNLIFERWSRNQNEYKEYFISGEEIRQHMTAERLRAAIVEIFPSYHVEQVLGAIQAGGHKTFAILILIKHPKDIDAFIEQGQNQSEGIDRLLPLDQAQLLVRFSNKMPPVVGFLREQRSFTAPVFWDNVFTKMLATEAILPFLSDKYLGSGGFGDVYSVEIAPSHQRFRDMSLRHRGVS